MKRVIWKDHSGRVRCSLLRDEDDESRPEIGLPVDPPPIKRIVCEAAQDVENEFILRGLVTWKDVMKSQNGVSTVINDILKRRIVEAFKLQELDRNGG